jgi:hypothetical protein
MSGVLKPNIDRVFSGFGEYVAAHYYTDANAHAGKVVVALD